MVRVNLIDPKALADQHLIAEYNEILMLLGYVIRYPAIKAGEIPQTYTLGKGHIRFFKNKLAYLKKRHESIKKEMRLRGFETNKTISLAEFPKFLQRDWTPTSQDKHIIKARILEKLRKKPTYYRYYGKYKPVSFLVTLVRKAR